ncbi:MAG: histone deacetylase, partial [Rhodothermales bacterium]|nr:histone deacetylase [Rhodothermales bacterium]
NGNAAVFVDAPHVYTFSMHGAKNYPFRKPPSDRDVPLPDGTGDAAYLAALRHHLPEVLHEARPDLVFYLGGIDVRAGDRFGRLALSRDGIARRDRFVIETVLAAGIPLVLLLSGGYAATPEETADLHATMYREAAAVVAGAAAA